MNGSWGEGEIIGFFRSFQRSNQDLVVLLIESKMRLKKIKNLLWDLWSVLRLWSYKQRFNLGFQICIWNYEYVLMIVEVMEFYEIILEERLAKVKDSIFKRKVEGEVCN